MENVKLESCENFVFSIIKKIFMLINGRTLHPLLSKNLVCFSSLTSFVSYHHIKDSSEEKTFVHFFKGKFFIFEESYSSFEIRPTSTALFIHSFIQRS